MQNVWWLSDVVRRSFRHGPLCAAMLALTGFGVLMMTGEGIAKTPGKTYCFGGVCHRVLTLSETRARVGKKTSALTSYYDDCRSDRFNPCGLTSSGALFRPGKADNAASPIYPNGTKLLVFNPRNGRAAVVRVNNAGPYKGRRTLDVSRGAATKLGFRHAGVARLIVKVVKAPTPSEASYRARRTYAPVPGYIGQFDSVAAALAASGYGGGAAPAQMLVGQAPDLMWATYAAKATPALPMPGAVEPAPLPEQPSLAFRQQLRKLAMAERRRQAIELRRVERARRVALAEAKARQEADEKRKRATAANKTKQQTARQSGTAKQAPARQVAAARAGQSGAVASNVQSGAQAQGQGASASPQAAPDAPVAPRRRTVWRREIVGVAQNSS